MFAPNVPINKDATTAVVDANTPHLRATSFRLQPTKTSDTSSATSSAANGRVTPSFDQQGAVKGGGTGRDGKEKRAIAYCAAEHVALLTYVDEFPNSLNASESSDEQKLAYNDMIQG